MYDPYYEGAKGVNATYVLHGESLLDRIGAVFL
jgi:hypothetical protein